MHFNPNVPKPEPLFLIMAKAPRAGAVKTRLCPPLSEDHAALLAACFAQDVVAAVRAVCPRVLLAYAPLEGRSLLEPLLPPGLLWTPQRGETLGERMQGAFEAADTSGFSPLVMLGTDSPTLPPTFLDDALQLLTTDRADVVLGPTEDGGFYLVGVRHPFAGLFANVAWSTAQTLANTLRNAVAMNLRVTLLPTWYDVDVPEDLEHLCAEFGSEPTARDRAPQTYHWLRAHSLVLPR